MIDDMEELSKKIADAVALGLELGAVLIIAYGAGEAFYHTLRACVRNRRGMGDGNISWCNSASGGCWDLNFNSRPM